MNADQKPTLRDDAPDTRREPARAELETAIRRIYGEAAAEPLPAQLVALVKRLAAKG